MLRVCLGLLTCCIRPSACNETPSNTASRRSSQSFGSDEVVVSQDIQNRLERTIRRPSDSQRLPIPPPFRARRLSLD